MPKLEVTHCHKVLTRVHNIYIFFYIYTSVIKIENFKKRIGIAEKSHETRRDC